MARDRLVILGSAVGALAVARNGHRLGLDVVVADHEAGIACASRRASSVILPITDNALETVASLGRESPHAALLATSDTWLRFVRDHRPALASAFHAILHPRNDVLDICLSKTAFSRWCEANRIPSPRAWTGDDDVEAHLSCPQARRLARQLVSPPLPVILRPDRTCHDATVGVPKAIEAATFDDLDDWRLRFREANVSLALTESLLGRPLVQYSAPFVRTAGKTLLFVAEKRRPTSDRCGVGTYLEARPRPDIEAFARTVVDRLDCDGVGEIEILHDEARGEMHVIEVNPRPWTQYSLSTALGFDFLGEALGRRQGVQTQPARSVRWMDFRNDLYTVLSRSEGMLREGRIGWGEYLRSLLRARAFAKFAWTDPGPFFVDVGMLVRSVVQRVRSM